MKEESVWITNRFGEKLEAIYRKPYGDGPFPTVLFVSGFGANLHEDNNSFDEISLRLITQGFATIQFSFAGRGKSGGNYNDITQKRQAEQIEDVITWLCSRKLVDISRVGVLALSFGVASTLAANVNKVKSFILLSGVYFPLKSMKEMFQLRGEFIPNGISWRKQSDGSITRVSPEFWNVLKTFETKRACSRISAPVYVLHGDHDEKISVQEVQQAYQWFLSKKKRLKIYPNGDHGMNDVPRPIREELLQDIVNWFKNTL